jgi:hypothetical protein
MAVKKSMIAIAALAVVSAGLGAAWWLNRDTAPAVAAREFPDAPQPGQVVEQAPQVSQRTFELPPSEGTGTYRPAAAGKPELKSNDSKDDIDAAKR